MGQANELNEQGAGGVWSADRWRELGQEVRRTGESIFGCIERWKKRAGVFRQHQERWGADHFD